MLVGTRGWMKSIADGSMWAARPPPDVSPDSPFADAGFSEIRYALPVDSVPARTIMSIRALVQGNQRVVCRQSYDGDLVELFSAQSCTRHPQNMVRSSLFACNWLEFDYLRFCTPKAPPGSASNGGARAALGWQVVLDGGTARAEDLQGTYQTTYAGGVIPVTVWVSPLVECTTFCFAPQDESARFGGAIYVLRIRSRSGESPRGRIVLSGPGDAGAGRGPFWDEDAKGMAYQGRSMLGHSEAHALIAPRDKPARATTEDEAGITGLEWDLSLQPGEMAEYAVSIGLADRAEGCREQIEALQTRSVDDWLRRTLASSSSSTERLSIESGEWWTEFLTNHLQRGINALRIGPEDRIAGAAVAPEW